MTEKFTYFDFQMYLLPGAVLLVGLLTAWVAAGGQAPELFGDAGLFASVVFVLAAFVCGHFVQTLGHTLSEKLLKIWFWGGRYPSEILLFNGAPIIAATERDRHIALLRARGLASDDDVACWGGEVTVGRFRRRLKGIDQKQFDAGAESAQFAFNRIRNHLADKGAGARATTAEANYQFFRGGFTAAALVSLTLAVEIPALRMGWAAPFNNALNNTALGAGAATLFCLFAVAFFWRARGARQAVVRETFRAYAAWVRESTQPSDLP